MVRLEPSGCSACAGFSFKSVARQSHANLDLNPHLAVLHLGFGSSEIFWQNTEPFYIMFVMLLSCLLYFLYLQNVQGISIWFQEGLLCL